MPIYHKLGQIPAKRHVQFRKPDGNLYYEQLFGTIGFDGMSSLLYHHHRPTMVKAVGEAIDVQPRIAVAKNMLSRKLIGFQVPPQDDFLASRVALLVNSDIHVGVAAPICLKTLQIMPIHTTEWRHWQKSTKKSSYLARLGETCIRMG